MDQKILCYEDCKLDGVLVGESRPIRCELSQSRFGNCNCVVSIVTVKIILMVATADSQQAALYGPFCDIADHSMDYGEDSRKSHILVEGLRRH